MNIKSSIFNLNNYSFSYGDHRGQNVIFIDFPNDFNLRNQLREKLKITWSQSNKKWYCIDMPQYRTLLQLTQKPIGSHLEQNLSEENKVAFQLMRNEIILKGYSPNTQKVYLSEFYQLLSILNQYPVYNLSDEKLKAYVLYSHNILGLKETTIHSRINAIKFYFEKVLKRSEIFLEIPRPKKPSTLPKVISKQDIKRMFNLIQNLKHRLALRLVYGMGLRVSEIVNLKITDIDSKILKVHLRCAKGKKDRYVPLPVSVLDELRQYYKEYKPKEFLFEGMTGGKYTVRSVQAVFQQAMKRANINKQVGVHGLRHSYATHLLDSGVDSAFIQRLLGHHQLKTTMIYTRVSQRSLMNIASPLDDL